ncbi:hypothetical protein [uncultured Nocardioides sp.]|uniref:hypothetical protein n=1 Tax=uncultured Nocardioides sp. TaxID=198441 RepID=UPI0025F0FA9C|nr:hypothetical protein [uncultured Nocardioides sp.]
MTTEQSDRAPDHHVGATAERHSRLGWWHHSHPTFSALAGFFAGMLFVIAVPAGFAGVLRLLFSYETAERFFPLVAIGLVVPIALLAKRKTRRFGIYMAIGMAVTALVVVGVASLVLYFMVRLDG